jgi:hypothetical protein
MSVTWTRPAFHSALGIRPLDHTSSSEALNPPTIEEPRKVDVDGDARAGASTVGHSGQI